MVRGGDDMLSYSYFVFYNSSAVNDIKCYFYEDDDKIQTWNFIYIKIML